jgi:hypothetical protein
MSKGWIAVDLDGTLAEYGKWKGIEHIGDPVPLMLARVKRWLSEGKQVKIFTARANAQEAIPYIQKWCRKHIGQVLPITATKDYGMIELWDDRCVQVVANTGRPVSAALNEMEDDQQELDEIREQHNTLAIKDPTMEIDRF